MRFAEWRAHACYSYSVCSAMYTYIYIYISCCRFDQHAQIDLPAMLDYVLNVTGQKQLFYLGHSQGTIMGFAGFTINQKLASHVKAFFGLAPVAYLKHIEGGFRILSNFTDEISVRYNKMLKRKSISISLDK